MIETSRIIHASSHDMLRIRVKTKETDKLVDSYLLNICFLKDTIDKIYKKIDSGALDDAGNKKISLIDSIKNMFTKYAVMGE